MFSPLDTRIAFFGGACSVAALEAVVRLVDAGYEMVAGPHDPREGVVLNALRADVDICALVEEVEVEKRHARYSFAPHCS